MTRALLDRNVQQSAGPKGPHSRGEGLIHRRLGHRLLGARDSVPRPRADAVPRPEFPRGRGGATRRARASSHGPHDSADAKAKIKPAEHLASARGHLMPSMPHRQMCLKRAHWAARREPGAEGAPQEQRLGHRDPGGGGRGLRSNVRAGVPVRAPPGARRAKPCAFRHRRQGRRATERVRSLRATWGVAQQQNNVISVAAPAAHATSLIGVERG